MPMVKNVEEKIRRVEGFRVAFTSNGVDVKGNKENIPQYTYEVAAPGSWTVAEWCAKRFNMCYPGYGVRVFTQMNVIASGNMALNTVRGKK